MKTYIQFILEGLGGFFLDTILHSPPMNTILYIPILEEMPKYKFSESNKISRALYKANTLTIADY